MGMLAIAFQSGQNNYGNTLLACIQHSNFQFLFIVLATTGGSSQTMKGVLKLLVFGFVLFMVPVKSAPIEGGILIAS